MRIIAILIFAAIFAFFIVMMSLAIATMLHRIKETDGEDEEK
jgi:hypothetical protein